MSEVHTPQPAILFSRFEASAEQIAMAGELIGLGHTVISACAPGSPAAAAARGIGCAVVEAGGEGGLRAGLTHFRDGMPSATGVVVLDAKRGFAVGDVLKVAGALEVNPDRFAVAARPVSAGAGLMLRLERWAAAAAFTLVHGRRVADPWSGLLAIPAGHVSGFLGLKGEGSRLMFNMALNLQHLGIRAVSVPVNVPDEPENDQGFWDRVADILRILLLPLKFISASLMATLFDYATYSLTHYVIGLDWQVAQTLARAAGAITGYVLNRSVVFKRRKNSVKQELVSILQFTALALANYGLSLLSMGWLMSLGFPGIVAKMLTDIVLFSTSYLVQREVIFRRKATASRN